MQQEVQLFSSYKFVACFQLWRPVRKHTRAAALSLAASPCFGSDLKAPSGQKMSIYHVIFRILQEKISSKYLIPKWRTCRSYTIYYISSSFPCSDPPFFTAPPSQRHDQLQPFGLSRPRGASPRKGWGTQEPEPSCLGSERCGTENGKRCHVSCVSLKTWVGGKSWENSWSKPHVDHVGVQRRLVSQNKWEEFDDEKPMRTSKIGISWEYNLQTLAA